MDNFKNDPVLKSVVSRLRKARISADLFRKDGYTESAEMWDTVAGVLEGVLYDVEQYELIKELKKGN